MSDQGLSIFDNEPGSAPPPEPASKTPHPDNETTQVMPVTTSAPTQPAQAASPPSRPAPTGAPGSSLAALPVVRRNAPGSVVGILTLEDVARALRIERPIVTDRIVDRPASMAR